MFHIHSTYVLVKFLGISSVHVPSMVLCMFRICQLWSDFCSRSWSLLFHMRFEIKIAKPIHLDTQNIHIYNFYCPEKKRKIYTDTKCMIKLEYKEQNERFPGFRLSGLVNLGFWHPDPLRFSDSEEMNIHNKFIWNLLQNKRFQPKGDIIYHSLSLFTLGVL